MRLLSQFRRKLDVLFHRERFDRDLEEEMRSHLDMEAEANRANGMDAARAHYAAKRQFGNGALLKEDSRAAWGWGPVERVLQDVRYAARVLRKNPGFTAVAVLSLALGIGANTAVFTVINAALLRTLPVRNPDRLAIAKCSTGAGIKGVWTKNSNNYTDSATGRRINNTFSLATLRDFRAQASDAMEVFAFFSPGAINANDGSGNRQVRLTLVSGNFFAGLGVPMALGRGLLDGDDQPGASSIVVTYSFWDQSLGRDPSVLGRVLRLNGAPMTIVGVSGPGFRGVAASGFDGPAGVFAPLSSVDSRGAARIQRLREAQDGGRLLVDSDYGAAEARCNREPRRRTLGRHPARLFRGIRSAGVAAGQRPADRPGAWRQGPGRSPRQNQAPAPDLTRRGGHRASVGVRQSGQPSDGALGGAQKGDRRPAVARVGPRAHRQTTPHREPALVGDGRRGRLAAGDPGRSGHLPPADRGTHVRRRLAGSLAGYAASGVHHARGGSDERPVRLGAGMAGHARRCRAEPQGQPAGIGPAKLRQPRQGAHCGANGSFPGASDRSGPLSAHTGEPVRSGRRLCPRPVTGL